MARPAKSQRAMSPGFNKSETVTVRLSPKHRFAVELLARMQRQTVSAVIEGLIRERFGAALQNLGTPEPASLDAERLALALDGDVRHVGDLLTAIWDPREPDRFANAATVAPGLLSEDEELLWRLIREAPQLWRKRDLDRKALRDNWAAILRAADRGAPSLELILTKE